MARSEARVSVNIWTDDDFRALSTTAQRMYLFLLSQADMAQDGVIALRERRWSKTAHGLTVDQVAADLDELEKARFVVVDHDTEEVLVRSFIRGDKVYQQPNVFRAAAKHLEMVDSPTIRATLHIELERIGSSMPLGEGSAIVLADMLKALGDGSSNPSANPSEDPSPKGSRVGREERGVVTAVSSDSPLPLPLSPHPCPPQSPEATSDARPARAAANDGSGDRLDVERVCRHLADRIEANGSKRPVITKRWRQEARRLLDLDGRTVDQVITAIDWCQNDGFWRSNVLSMPKLREKYDQLRLAAQREQAAGPGPARRISNRFHNDPADDRADDNPFAGAIRSSDYTGAAS